MTELGRDVPGWRAPEPPVGAQLSGRYAQLEKLDPTRHAEELFAAFQGADQVWNYLPYGPFASFGDYLSWVQNVAAGQDPLFYAVRDLSTGKVAGVASYLRIAPEAGSIEVGHINFSPALQRSRAATETMYLMMQWAFDAGYRRYEWKCNALNIGSRRAAARLGLSYEGVFRQAAVVKGRNRDTAWFAAIDSEWPALKAAFDAWLAPQNFDDAGQQRRSLADMTRGVLVGHDPALLGTGA